VKPVQINLLPASKAEAVKSQASQNQLTHWAKIAAIASASLLIVLLALVYGLQKKLLSDAAKNLTAASNQLAAVPDLNKTLTVKNQLSTLTTLHSQKHAVERLFKYLPQVTPARATINSLNLDFKNSSLKLAGNADSLQTVSGFIDALKSTQFTADSQNQPQAAFNSVVETSFTLSPGGVTYGLSFKFAPALFDNHLTNVVLKIPPRASSSVQDVNGSLFQGGQ